jgi:hypothetical protein
MKSNPFNDKFKQDDYYYGGIKKQSNSVVVSLCLTFMLFGMTLHLLAAMKNNAFWTNHDLRAELAARNNRQAMEANKNSEDKESEDRDLQSFLKRLDEHEDNLNKQTSRTGFSM